MGRVTVITYGLLGLLAGVAGVMEFSTLTVGDPTDSIGLELEVIASVVIGGTLARHPHVFEPRLRELLPFVLPEEQLVRTEIAICPASNGDEAFGAATVVLHHIFSPLQVDVEDVL